MEASNLTCELCGAPAFVADEKHASPLGMVLAFLLGLAFFFSLAAVAAGIITLLAPVVLFVLMLVVGLAGNQKRYYVKCTNCGATRKMN